MPILSLAESSGVADEMHSHFNLLKHIIRSAQR